MIDYELIEKSIKRVMTLKPIKEKMALREWRLNTTSHLGTDVEEFTFTLSFIRGLNRADVTSMIELKNIFDILPLTGKENPIDEVIEIDKDETSPLDRLTLRLGYVFLSVWKNVMGYSPDYKPETGYASAVIPINIKSMDVHPDPAIYEYEDIRKTFIDTGVKVEVKPEVSESWGKKIDSSKIFYDYAKADSIIIPPTCHVSAVKPEAVYVDWSDAWSD